MGGCYSGNGLNKDEMNEKNATLSKDDVQLIKNSWKLVAKDDGLCRYGTNMMIR